MSKNTGFYFRCVACNTELSTIQQTNNLCTDCYSVVKISSNPIHHEKDLFDMENVMWKNPMGYANHIEDAEADYTGTSDNNY